MQKLFKNVGVTKDTWIIIILVYYMGQKLWMLLCL